MPRLRPLALVLLALAACAPSLGVGFLTDDFDLVASFSHLTLAQLLSYFGRFYSGEYRPLYFLSFGLDHALWGTWSPGYHLTNVAFHAVNSLLVAALARELRLPEPAPWIAGSLFAVHGGCVGAVVWVSGRVDVMATTFVLAGAVAFLRYEASGGSIWLVLSAAAQAFGLLTKETGAVLAAWALLMALASGRRRLLACVPLLLVLLAYVLFWVFWLGPEISYTDPLGATPHQVWSGVTRMLSVFGFPLTSAVWSSPRVDALAALATAALALLGLASVRREPRTAVLLPGLLGASLLPVLTLLEVPRDLYHSRHYYLPGVMLTLLAALGLCALASRSVALLGCLTAASLLFQASLLELNVRHWARNGALARSVSEAVASAAHRLRAERIVVTGYPDMERGYFLFHGNSIEQAVRLAYPDLKALRVQCLGTYGCPALATRDAGSPLVRVRVVAFRIESWSVDP